MRRHIHPEDLRQLLGDLDPRTREEADRDIAWATGLLATSRGEGLDRLVAPAVPVSGAARIVLWRNRYWVARWAIVGIVVGLVITAVAAR